MGISKTKEMYEKGLDEMKSGRIEHGFDLLSSAFLFRLGRKNRGKSVFPTSPRFFTRSTGGTLWNDGES